MGAKAGGGAQPPPIKAHAPSCPGGLEILDFGHVLLRHEPAFDKTLAVWAIRLFALGDKDGLLNGLLGAGVAAQGYRPAQALVHGIG